MARSIATGEWQRRQPDGFTILELMIVVSIVGILATLAVPSYQASVLRARETALRHDLFTIRDLLDQHRADQGKYPGSLQALVSAGYLRKIPADPFTASTTTWQEITEPAVGGVEGGVFDVFSGSDLVGTNGMPYNQW
ncbi:MAG TPA: prepilin-type N-terminal cleavage/methylation domain-containing protein [Nitrospiraceae bacterium]|nr:prepilin-type N-terminal cleavage/methylation domain-containing protein [Nitrospiraceae bacterium]